MLLGRRIALLLLLGCSARARGANGIYGGEADKPHLGGFVDVSVQGGFDRDGLSPRLWRYMLSNWTVHSVIDVGCGRGATSLWFHLQDARVRCVEGSSEAVRQSLLPRGIITQHDFTAGPYVPDETYDMAWSVEFLEHVRSDKMNNYIATLRKARAPTGYRPASSNPPRGRAHAHVAYAWRRRHSSSSPLPSGEGITTLKSTRGRGGSASSRRSASDTPRASPPTCDLGAISARSRREDHGAILYSPAAARLPVR